MVLSGFRYARTILPFPLWHQDYPRPLLPKQYINFIILPFYVKTIFYKGGTLMTPNIPKDPVMLLSYLNTQLRDFYPTLEECCRSLNLSQAQIEETLAAIDYHYDDTKNKFV